ncbi:MAG: hypothetical protein KBS81_01645, partial [Spirochaetales bacterium]|nr:hypothetical protein [Candidatus Physcosoma equi]
DRLGMTLFKNPTYQMDLLRHLVGDIPDWDEKDVMMLSLGDGIVKKGITDLAFLIKERYLVLIEIQTLWTEKGSQKAIQRLS